MRGIVLFAHGSRDPEWARPFEMIRDRVRDVRPEYPIELAFLDFIAPTLEEAIAALASRGATAITVYPLFMAAGGHLKSDLPKLVEAIRGDHPHVPIALETSVGEVPEIQDVIAAWVLSRAD